MKFIKDILNRITGINIMGSGVSFVPENMKNDNKAEALGVARGNLMNFLRKIHESKYQTVPDSLMYGGLIKSYEEEIGPYRFSKLYTGLDKIGICKFSESGSVCSPYHNKNYTKKDIEQIIIDVRNGVYDKYL